MSHLASTAITLCKADAPQISATKALALLQEIPLWTEVSETGITKLKKEFKFNNFNKALNFTKSIGELAELANHHPTIVTEWGKVTVRWWTHTITGLHLNDFIMAARVDALFETESDSL